MQARSPTVWRSCAAYRAKIDRVLRLLYSASVTKRNARPGFCTEGMDQISATLPIRWTCSFTSGCRMRVEEYWSKLGEEPLAAEGRGIHARLREIEDFVLSRLKDLSGLLAGARFPGPKQS
jgi:hypothetical protein